MAGTAGLYTDSTFTVGVNSATGANDKTAIGVASTDWAVPYVNADGFDLIWRQKYLQGQMAQVEQSIRDIEQNANLSDTEKMFSMQMAMNTWSAISNLRTNMLKTVADTLKAIARNVA